MMEKSRYWIKDAEKSKSGANNCGMTAKIRLTCQERGFSVDRNASKRENLQLSAQKIGLFFRKLLFEESSGDRFFLVCHLFGCAKSHDISAISTPFRTKVNDIIGALYHIHIVLYDYYAMAVLYELVE